jgi:radical SAM protein with 4Fe4S-binding SPASM domain
MNGISTINIELTSRCNKQCHMCGRRQLEKENPKWKESQGDMDWRTFRNILPHLEPGMIVQLHWNGEPTLYHNIQDASIALKKIGCIVSMNTNALMLGDHWREFVHFDSIACSVIEGDSSENYIRQMKQITLFLLHTQNIEKPPLIIIRSLGNVPPGFMSMVFNYTPRVMWATRVLHAPEMSREYRKRPIMPEIGVCLDLLSHLAIDRYGDVYPCVRFNPEKVNCLGNVIETKLCDIANNSLRKGLIHLHLSGRRKEALLCRDCHYWGCPTGV